MSEKSRFRVLADYEVHDPHPLRLEAGTAVEVLRPDLGWPGWVWVESGGQTGWIPESHLRHGDGPNPVTVQAFDGSDLSARRSDVLQALGEAPGWIYAEAASGKRGWFPLFNLRPLQHT
jgi:hypothetical protein